jgi:acetolactate synthase-1/2/3 large subunit
VAGTGASDLPPATVAAALLDVLELEGVTSVFGIPGGALLEILAELKARQQRLTFYICRQETGAAYLADGYARATGGLGVVVVTSGPGAVNALTGCVNAHASGTSMLAVTGEVATAYFGRGYLQEGVDAPLDVADVFRDAVGYSEIVTAASNLEELLFTALRVARGVPGQVAHLSVPNDVAASVVTGYSPPTTTASYRSASGFVDGPGVEDAVAAIAGADRPLLLLGSSCRRPLADDRTLQDVVAAVESLSVPVVTEPEAKGIFPETHELSLRNYGIAGCEWPKHYLYDAGLGQYDVLVVLGSQLGELATNSWDPLLVPTGQLIQIGDDQKILGRAFPLSRGVVGETGAALAAFTDAAGQTSVDARRAERRRQLVAGIKASHSPFAYPGARESAGAPVKPQTLIRLLAEAVPARTHLFVDAGNCVGWCLNGLVVDPPTRVHASLAMGPMGFAVGAVVGAKIGDPDATCVAVVGDGAFLMQVGEVATAAQYGIGAIWVVLADHDLKMVSQGMAHFTGDPSFEDYYRLAWADLGKVAEGLGATAYVASAPDEVEAALRSAVAGAEDGVPQVVSVTIDSAEMPPYYTPRYPPPPEGDPPR